jgi:hypothetical protein
VDLDIKEKVEGDKIMMDLTTQFGEGREWGISHETGNDVGTGEVARC